MKRKHVLKIKRIYEVPDTSDGVRVLVDRLWPRGISKERAALDEWMKDIAPSPELRVWFGHDPARFKEFGVRYRLELKSSPALARLVEMAKVKKNVTLLYAAKDPAISHALVLRGELERLLE